MSACFHAHMCHNWVFPQCSVSRRRNILHTGVSAEPVQGAAYCIHQINMSSFLLRQSQSIKLSSDPVPSGFFNVGPDNRGEIDDGQDHFKPFCKPHVNS